MKRFILKCITLVLFFTNLWSCDKNDTADLMGTPVENNITGIQNERWKTIFNDNINYMDSLYTSNAIVLTENNIYKGSEEIKQLYLNLKSVWISIDTVFTNYEKKDIITPSVSYGIGTFITSTEKIFNHLIIWHEESSRDLRELEVIYKYKEAISMTDMLKQRRLDWVRESNSHNLNEFLNNLYFHNAYYYCNNSDKLYVGTPEIKSAYSYMTEPDWNILSLTPYYTKQINDSIIFEIGKYSVFGGSGDYSLLWKKSEDKIWKILLDSNY